MALRLFSLLPEGKTYEETHMTEVQKQKIISLRSQGFSYKQVGDELGLTKDCVKMFCLRNGCGRQNIKTDGNICPWCGRFLKQVDGKKKRRFCSTSCRQLWWNKNKELLHHRKTIEQACPTCGKRFEAYPTADRKYCSHKCYIIQRFKIAN